MARFASAACDLSGEVVVAGNDDGVLSLSHLGSDPLRTWRGHGAPISGVALSPGGRWAFSWARDGTASLWDAAAGRLLAPVPCGAVQGCIVARDAPKALLLSGNCLELWDAGTGCCLARYAADARLLSFHADQSLAVVIAADEHGDMHHLVAEGALAG